MSNKEVAMSHPNKVKQVWADGGTARNCWLSFADPSVVEALAGQGFDLLTVDLQHGQFDRHSAAAAIRIILTSGAAPFVRLAGPEPDMINAMLDAGAVGLICPFISTPEDAAAFVEPCRYPPVGMRSYGPLMASLRHGPDYFQKAADLVVCLGMIETKSGYDTVEAIAATPGLDGLFIGPNDLALALGGVPQSDNSSESALETYRRVLGAAKAANKACGIYNTSPAYGAQMAAMGFDLVNAATDAGLLLGGAHAALKAFDGAR